MTKIIIYPEDNLDDYYERRAEYLRELRELPRRVRNGVKCDEIRHDLAQIKAIPYKKNTDPCYYCGKVGLHYCVMRGGTG